MDDRERKLRNARRLRRGVVTTGVVGSLGVAGLVGLPALQQATVGTPSAGQGQTTTRYDNPQQPAVGEDDGGHGGWVFDDDSGASSQGAQGTQGTQGTQRTQRTQGSQQWNPPSAGFAPPTVGNGGTPHAGTTGS